MSDSTLSNSPLYRVDISVVVPVFHSADMLDELFTRTSAVLDALEKTWEIVFVEDGGSDDSWTRILALKNKFPEKITAIKLSKNFGQNSATMCGLVCGTGEVFITIDDDLQTPPEEIPKMLENLKETGADLVYGAYPVKKHSWFRNFGSNMIKAFFRRLVKGTEIGSSFRVMKAGLAGNLSQHATDFLFIDQIVPWYTNSVSFQEVQHHERASGSSGYTTFDLIKIAFNLIFNYTDIPLKMMTYTGLIGSLLSFGVGIYFVYEKLTVGAELGFTSIIASIFFGTSITLFCLGIVGEYIKRIYTSKVNKPVFSIKVKL